MSEPSPAEIRAWARVNGHAVADRGRVPAGVVAAYEAAHQTTTTTAGTISRPPRRPVVRREGSSRQGLRPATAPEASTEAREAPAPDAEEPTRKLHPPDEPTWQRPAPEEPTWQPPAPTARERPAWKPTAWDAPSAAPPPSSPPPTAPAHSPTWGPPPPPAKGGQDGFAITSLVLGIIPVLAGILAIVFGLIALGRIRRSGRRGKGMAVAGIVLGSLWLVGTASAAVIVRANSVDRTNDEPVVARGSVAATELRTGDCPSTLPDSAARTLGVVTCTEPHVAEVFASFLISSSAYPGEAELKRFGGGGCTDRLAAFVGPGREDQFDVVFLYPTDQSWRLGDRAVSCMVTTSDGSPLPPGSVKTG